MDVATVVEVRSSGYNEKYMLEILVSWWEPSFGCHRRGTFSKTHWSLKYTVKYDVFPSFTKLFSIPSLLKVQNRKTANFHGHEYCMFDSMSKAKHKAKHLQKRCQCHWSRWDDVSWDKIWHGLGDQKEKAVHMTGKLCWACQICPVIRYIHGNSQSYVSYILLLEGLTLCHCWSWKVL